MPAVDQQLVISLRLLTHDSSIARLHGLGQGRVDIRQHMYFMALNRAPFSKVVQYQAQRSPACYRAMLASITAIGRLASNDCGLLTP